MMILYLLSADIASIGLMTLVALYADVFLAFGAVA
jgi:hypothetical protein